MLPTEPHVKRRGKVKIANAIAKSSEQVNSLKLKISIPAGFVVVFLPITLEHPDFYSFCSSKGYSKMKKKKKKKMKKKKEQLKKKKKKSPGA